MSVVAILRNWTEEGRKGGSAWIDLVNANGDNEVSTVTVAKGQSAKAALQVAGWEIISGVLRKKHGDPSCLVRRSPAVADGPAARMSRIVRECGLT